MSSGKIFSPFKEVSGITKKSSILPNSNAWAGSNLSSQMGSEKFPKWLIQNLITSLENSVRKNEQYKPTRTFSGKVLSNSNDPI